jgi:hypothetical protein
MSRSFKPIVDFINHEPALVMGFLGAAINLAVAFGLPITAEQASLLNIFIAAGVSVIVRQHVSPVVDLVSK